MHDLCSGRVEWRDLSALSRNQACVELGLPLPWLLIAVLAGALHCWTLVVIASLAIFMAGLRVSHDLFHRSLGLSERATSRALFVLSVLLGGALHAIEYTHLRHHRDCLATDDVEGQIAALPFWRALLHSPAYPWRIHLAALRHGSVRQRRWIRLELAAVVCVIILVGAMRNAVLQCIAATLVLANASAAMVGIWAVHRGCRHGDARIARSTRSRLLA